MAKCEVKATITDRHRDMARWIGNGNASLGIRLALSFYFDKISEGIERIKNIEEQVLSGKSFNKAPDSASWQYEEGVCYLEMKRKPFWRL